MGIQGQVIAHNGEIVDALQAAEIDCSKVFVIANGQAAAEVEAAIDLHQLGHFERRCLVSVLNLNGPVDRFHVCERDGLQRAVVPNFKVRTHFRQARKVHHLQVVVAVHVDASA